MPDVRLATNAAAARFAAVQEDERRRARLRQGGVRYDQSAMDLFKRFTRTPSAARRRLVHDLIVERKDRGDWFKNDAFYVLAMGCDDPGYATPDDAQAMRLNWIADRYNLIAVANPTFTADRGVQGDGASSYLRTGFNPGTAANPKYLLNSASMGVWLRSSAAGVGRMAMGGNTTAYATMEISVTNILVCQLNAANGASVSVAAAGGQTGLWASNRSAANAIKALRNGVSQSTDTDASSSVPNIEMFLGARSVNGVASNFSPDQMSAAFIGAAMSDAEHLSMYNALNTYLKAVGAV